MKLDIVMCVPGLPLGAGVLETGSIGGSETVGLQMAFALAARGHRIKLFATVQAIREERGVTFVPIQDFAQFVQTTPCDVLIAQRMPDVFCNRMPTKLNLLWCHDMAQGRFADQFNGMTWNVDGVLLLSDYMIDQYHQTYNTDKRAFIKTRNGIDLKAVDKAMAEAQLRHRKRLVYAARPERGIDNIAPILTELLKQDPAIDVAICSYYNPVEHLRQFYEHIGQLFRPFGDRVLAMGNLTKHQLYKLFGESAVLFYPTPSSVMKDFREVSCLSLMEAQACGLPIVSSNCGALPETLAPGAGVLIDGDPWSMEYRIEAINALLRLTSDDAYWQSMSDAGRAVAPRFCIDALAAEWEAMFLRMIDERNESPARLLNHFYKTNDIMAARELLRRDRDDMTLNPLSHKIEAEYAFTQSRETFAEHYARGGEDTDARLSKVDVLPETFNMTGEKRFIVLENVLRQRTECENIFEFGCGHGWSTIYYHNKLGRKWFGVDVDPGAIKWAKHYAKDHAKDPKALTFIEADDMDVRLGPAGETRLASVAIDYPYDCALVSEVLEHCVDPIATMEGIEQWVKQGGLVLITVPYGPSEYGTPNWVTFRNHLWCFDLHDLEEIFGAKPGFEVHAVFDHLNEVTRDPVGFFMVTYRADGKPLGKIDWDRKLRLQRPRLTVGSLTIAGPNAEQTLEWSMDSYKWVVDKVYIGDTGLSSAGLAIADRFGADIKPAPNPLEVGFDDARNSVLARIDTDVVFWIDADERLLDGANLTKYMRDSLWNGWSIRQHHFSVDASFHPDMPVRCFRRRPYQDKTMRFVGRIHEHPELGVNLGPGPVLVVTDVNIAHVGYLAESGRQVRFWRNHPLLKKDMEDYPDRLLQKHFIIRDNMLLAKFNLQRNGGVVTDEIRGWAQEAAELYRKHFLGKPMYANMDALGYYSEALSVLGEGVDVSFSMLARRGDRGDQMNGGMICRFASVEEAQQEISARVRDKMLPLLRSQW